SLAVWDVSSPVVAGRRATLKVGITCPSNCDLTGTRVDVYDEAGARVGGGEIMSGPWPGTDALYWTECDVVAPPTEGEHAWNVRAALPGDSRPRRSDGPRPRLAASRTPCDARSDRKGQRPSCRRCRASRRCVQDIHQRPRDRAGRGAQRHARHVRLEGRVRAALDDNGYHR